MVLEGHDSTVRPKVKTYEFDGGRMYLDSWAADGKPVLSKRFLGLSRAGGVVAATGTLFMLVLSDWNDVAGDKEHVFTPVQRGVRTWWSRFTEMDEFDVIKARSVKPKGWSPGSYLASEEAMQRYSKS